MAELTKEWLKKKLKLILKGIDESEQDDYNWYFDILWEDFENEDDSMGVIEEYFATELALVNEEDVLLYAELFQSTDPDHEEPSYFEESFARIVEKYGWSKTIYPLLYAHSFVHGQHNLEIITMNDAEKLTEFFKKDDNLNEFLKGLAEWINKYDYYDYQLENVFRTLLDEALNLKDDKEIEDAVEKFIAITAKGNIPKEGDFK